MKTIRIILFSLLALSLIVSTAVFIFLQTFDSDKYLSLITQKASLVLGRPVSIAGVGLGISLQGITLDAGPVTVGDDPGFTAQPFIKIDKVRFNLDLRSLIFDREIHITQILLQSPQVHFIRSLDGYTNLRSIGKQNHTAADSAVRSIGDGNNKSSPDIPIKEHALIWNTTVNSISIRDASVSYIDQNQFFPLDIWVNGLDATLTDFSLSKPFQLSFDASIYSDLPNVQGKALVNLGLEKRSVHLSDLRLGMDLSPIDINSLKGISPEMPGKLVFKSLAGKVELNLAHLEVSHSGGLKADGNLIVTDGVIKDFNIIKTLLSNTLGVFGGVQVNIDNLFSGRLKDKLGAADTVINEAEAEFSIHDRTIFLDKSSIETNIFELTAKGSLDKGLNMDMQTILHLNNDVSAALVNELEGFKFLYDDSNRIAVGASLTGVFPHLKYKPNKDFRKKSKRALMQEGGNILGVLLGGAPISTQGKDASVQDNGKEPKKNFKNIFKSLLQ